MLSALDYALERVDPAVLVKCSVKFDRKLSVTGMKGDKITFDNVEKIYVVGAGKACARMTESLCSILGRRLTQAAITIPYGEKTKISQAFASVVKVTHGAHPVPDSSGLQGSKRILDVLAKASNKDIIFVLISGGGSALLPFPAPGLKLSDKQRMTNSLLRSGATIQEVNIVRKHLSAIKGGQLLRHTNNARVVSLILSDVIDDDMSSIASGPTYPDASTFSDALKIIKKYKLGNASDSAVNYIMNGTQGLVSDTPKPGDAVFDKVHNILIGNNEVACLAAVSHLRRHRIKAAYLGSRFDGEAREFGSFLARLADDLQTQGRTRFAVVLGGETTVMIEGAAGKGGRNQEAGLSCAIEGIRGPLVACIGTDGIDGKSDAAGSLVSSLTAELAKAKGIDLQQHLDRHDSYQALKAIHSLIFTGKTGTNVNDMAIICGNPAKNLEKKRVKR